MGIESNLIISLLKLTKNGSVSNELVKKDSGVATSICQRLLEKLQTENLLNLQKGNLTVNGAQRVKLAVYAIASGADLENTASFLQWKEFEDMASTALERNGFSVAENVRFKNQGKRWEIDVVGCKKPLVVCVDCKHWHRGMAPSALKRIVEEQEERTLAFSKHLPSPSLRIECATWTTAKFIPAVLSLVAGRFKFYDDVPIVPVLQLQDFLNQLPAYANSLKHFSKGTATLKLDHDFSQRLL